MPEIGTLPKALGPVARETITLLVFTTTLTSVACIFSCPSLQPSESTTRDRILSRRELAILLGPFTVVYLALVLPFGAEGTLFNRYLLPVLAVALIIVLRLYEQKVATRLPTISLVFVFLVAAYSVAAMHDFYAVQRARLLAVSEIRAAGVPRTSFYGGFAYDGWTQAESWGYVVGPHINLPPGIQRAPSWNPSSDPCSGWFADIYPAIHPRYAVSFDKLACHGPASFAPVRYSTWLPPYTGSIYIQTVAVAASP